MAGKLRIKSRYSEGDFGVLTTTLILTVFGVIMVYSASYYTALSKYGDPGYYLRNNMMWMAIGWAVFVLFAFVDYHAWGRLAVPGMIVAFFTLLLIFTPKSWGIAVTLNNATRWIRVIPGRDSITFMPGEITKVALILFIAWFYASGPKRIHKILKGHLIILGVAGAAFVLIYKQPNLSTAGIVVLLAVGMMLMAGLAWGWVLFAVGGGAGILRGGSVLSLIHQLADGMVPLPEQLVRQDVGRLDAELHGLEALGIEQGIGYLHQPEVGGTGGVEQQLFSGDIPALYQLEDCGGSE